MPTGSAESACSSPRPGPKNQVNAEQAPGTPVSDNRQPAHRAESKRPWAVRRADSPSWVEKIEQF